MASSLPAHARSTNQLPPHPPIAAIPLAFLLLPTSANAGKGKFTQNPNDPNDPIHASTYVHIAFPPTQSQIDDIKDKLTRAARTICDATDGQVLIDDIHLERNGLSADSADIIWFPDNAITRFEANGEWWYGHDTSRVLVANQVTFWAVAHELAHALFGLRDQYNRQRADKKNGCGLGESIEPGDVSDTVHTIMQEYKPVCRDLTGVTPQWTSKLCSTDMDCGLPSRCSEFSPRASEFNTQPWFEPPIGLGNDGVNWPGVSPGEKLWVSARLHRGLSQSSWTISDVSTEYIDVVGDVLKGSSHRIWLSGKATATPHVFELEAFIGPNKDELDKLSWTVDGVASGIATLTLEFDPLADFCGVVSSSADTYSLTTINGVAAPSSVTLDITQAQLAANYKVVTEYTGGGVSLAVDLANLCERNVGSDVFKIDEYGIPEDTGIGTGTYIGRTAQANQGAMSTEPVYQQLADCVMEDIHERWKGSNQRWVTSAQYVHSDGLADWPLIRHNLRIAWPYDSALNHGTFNPPSSLNIATPSPVQADPDANANGVACSTFTPSFDDSAIDAVDSVALLFDRSGSMEDTWSPLQGTARKIEWARAGAVGFAEAAEKPDPVTADVRLSVARFNHGVDMLPESGLLTSAPPNSQYISASQLQDMLDVEPFGSTAIGDAVVYAVDEMMVGGNASNAIFLLTDGENNSGDNSIQAATDAAVAAQVPVFIAPIGTFDASSLEPMASATEGMVFQTLAADEIPATFFAMRAAARSEDLSLMYEKSKISNSYPNLPGSVEYDVLVETGATRLVMLLSPSSDYKSTWDIDFTLSGPLGETITRDDPAYVTIDEDRFFMLIAVPSPSPGTWTITLEAPPVLETPKVNPEEQLLMAHVEHEGPRCRVSTSTTYIDDVSKEVTVYVEPVWNGRVGRGVDFTGSVRRPDGSIAELLLTDDGSGIAVGHFTNYSYDGAYQVRVACDAGADAIYAAGEDYAGDDVTIPAAFSRTGMGYFVLVDDRPLPLHGVCSAQGPDTDGDGLPDACDPDLDGDDVPNTSESQVDDSDGDGVTDIYDRDADNDGVIDGRDWDPTDFTSHRRYALGDFNGDGLEDLIYGEPQANGDGGQVVVKMAGEEPEIWTQDTYGVINATEPDDQFGAAVTVGDFDGDGYDDVAVGVPGEGWGSLIEAGAINILYGSATGLTEVGDQFFRENLGGVKGVPENYDHFGARLTVGDFNCDGYDDLVIGTPDEDIGAQVDAGCAHVIYGSAGGLSSVTDQWYQGNSGVNGTSEADDAFGDSLLTADFNADTCSDLVIGAPREDWGGVDAGNAYVMYGNQSGLATSGDWTIVQGVVAGTPAANDRFAERLWAIRRNPDAYDDLIVMVPAECGATLKGFHYLNGSAGGLGVAGEDWFCFEAVESFLGD